MYIYIHIHIYMHMKTLTLEGSNLLGDTYISLATAALYNHIDFGQFCWDHFLFGACRVSIRVLYR